MTETKELLFDPYLSIRTNRLPLDKEAADKFIELVRRVYAEKKPKRTDLQEIKKYLRDFPELSIAVFSLSETVQQNLIDKMLGQDLAKTALSEYTILIR